MLLTAQPVPVAPPLPRSARSLTFGPIQAEIEAADHIFDQAIARHANHLAPLTTQVQSYRGKRLRPAILFLTARAMGPVTPAHRTLAAVVEMIHTATLVHDDVLDEASTRRGGATINATSGNKVSILLGDMLFSQAYFLAATVDRRACELIGDATNRVCAGELMQIYHRGNFALTESEYTQIIEGKTAALTEISSRLGAIFAGGNETQVESLAAYGRYLGLAFQVADDLLDLVGDETTAGKTLGTDLDEQKMTLPMIHALRNLPSSEADQLQQVIRQGSAARSKVSEILHRAGAVEYARERAADYVRLARNSLSVLPRNDYRTILEQLADWAIRRDK